MSKSALNTNEPKQSLRRGVNAAHDFFAEFDNTRLTLFWGTARDTHGRYPEPRMRIQVYDGVGDDRKLLPGVEIPVIGIETLTRLFATTIDVFDYWTNDDWDQDIDDFEVDEGDEHIVPVHLHVPQCGAESDWLWVSCMDMARATGARWLGAVVVRGDPDAAFAEAKRLLGFGLNGECKFHRLCADPPEGIRNRPLGRVEAELWSAKPIWQVAGRRCVVAMGN